MESIHNFLKQFPHYTEDTFRELLPYLSKIEIKEDEYFLREGRTSRRLAFIEKGMVRIYYIHDGKEITKCFCRENNLTCSYSSMITQTPSESAIQAVEDSTLLILPYDALQKLYMQSPFWQQLGRLAGEQEYLIEEKHNKSMRDMSATERYMYILQNESDLLQRVPLNHLASYIQVTPETLSRIRKKISRT